MNHTGSGARPKGRLTFVFWLSAITTFWMLLVNMFGFVDTFTHSTLSLGRTWPFTQHGLFPATWDAHKFVEWTHRVLVSGLLILLFVLTVFAWIKYRRWLEVKVLTIVAIVFVFAEAALGAMAVLLVQPPVVTAFHMGIALIAFCGVTILTTVIGAIDRRSLNVTGEALRPQTVSRGYAGWTWFLLFYVLFAIYFGSFVAASGSGGAFQGFPFPTESRSVVHWMYWVDVTHRSIALGLVILLISLTVNAKRKQKRNDLYRVGLVLLGLTVLQAIGGILLIVTNLSIQAFLVHVCVVTCIFAVSSYMAVKVLPEFTRRPLSENLSGGRKSRRTRKDSALA